MDELNELETTLLLTTALDTELAIDELDTVLLTTELVTELATELATRLLLDELELFSDELELAIGTPQAAAVCQLVPL